MKYYGTFICWLREKIFVVPIHFYQKIISPTHPRSCRFHPTCSSYTITAIIRFGLLKGGLMALCRLLRCNPFCRAGYDPVPDHFSLRPFTASQQQGHPPDKTNTVALEVSVYSEEKEV